MRGWVEHTCKNFFPVLGELLKEMSIPVLYAQEKLKRHEMHCNTVHYSRDDWERYWGLMKGRAISEEAELFYSQYKGQSWKNILSIGDSNFERYGLLAASSAYMQGHKVDADATPASKGSPVWNPTEDGCWEKLENGHIKRLRAKCCKLADAPDVEALATELEKLSEYLEDMVKLDNGFDVNLEELGVGGLDIFARKHSMMPYRLWRTFAHSVREKLAACIPCR